MKRWKRLAWVRVAEEFRRRSLDEMNKANALMGLIRRQDDE